jgi:RNA-binding protein
MTLTSKQRAYLKSLAADLEPVFQIGKSSVSPEVTTAIAETFNTHELVKITVLKNCTDDVKEVAVTVSERTRSDLVQVIGRKFVLYKPFKDDPKIILPKSSKKRDAE